MVQTSALKDEIGNLEISMMRDKFQKVILKTMQLLRI